MPIKVYGIFHCLHILTFLFCMRCVCILARNLDELTGKFPFQCSRRSGRMGGNSPVSLCFSYVLTDAAKMFNIWHWCLLFIKTEIHTAGGDVSYPVLIVIMT